jgi:hypothetical protein
VVCLGFALPHQSHSIYPLAALSFARPPLPQQYTQLPQELQYSNLEVFLSADDADREAQKRILRQVAAEETDERDWRTRNPPPAATAMEGQHEQQQQQRQQQPAASETTETALGDVKIQRATDLGKTAWHAGTVTEGIEQVGHGLSPFVIQNAPGEGNNLPRCTSIQYLLLAHPLPATFNEL